MGYDTSFSRTFAPLDRTLFDTTPDLCGAVNLTLAALHLQSTACRKYFFPTSPITTADEMPLWPHRVQIALNLRRQ